MATFTNRATLTYNNQTINSNIATGEILEVLSATKTAVGENYSANSDITYVVSILNSGITPITGVTVTDNLGGYTVGTEIYYPLSYVEGSVRLFINGALSASPTVTGSTPITFSGITIPQGGNAILIYEASVTEFAPLAAGSTVVNTATINSTGVTTPVQASAIISVLNEADLAITKSISPSVVTENSRVTYTFVIQNFGNTDVTVADNATVIDLFSPILTDLEVSLDGNALAEGSGYTYNEATGRFATVPGVITVPAATFAQNPETGAIEITPGEATLTITGTI